MKIHINTFVRRQTSTSPFSHWICADYTLLKMVEQGLPNAKQGYRDGVLLVPVPPEFFFSGVAQLNAGDYIIGEYSARKEGEEPRKHTYAFRSKKMPAKSVYVVLYRHDVLAENKENETDADYEIVSVNASPTEQDAPIQPGTLIANHFEMSGGTKTHMTDSEFVQALKESVMFWKDKVLVMPEEMVEDLRVLIVDWQRSSDARRALVI